jgi:hypothetical protein
MCAPTRSGRQSRAEFSAALARRADKNARERSPVLKGLLRIRRYDQQETPYALQEGELFSWLQFGEAYSALRGWRPIPAALLSHSVLLCSGTEDNSLQLVDPDHSGVAPRQGKVTPDKHRSIRKKACPVKFFDTSQWKTLCESGVWPLFFPPETYYKIMPEAEYTTTEYCFPGSERGRRPCFSISPL